MSTLLAQQLLEPHFVALIAVAQLLLVLEAIVNGGNTGDRAARMPECSLKNVRRGPCCVVAGPATTAIMQREILDARKLLESCERFAPAIKGRGLAASGKQQIPV